jgi:hypothetical protein
MSTQCLDHLIYSTGETALRTKVEHRYVTVVLISKTGQSRFTRQRTEIPDPWITTSEKLSDHTDGNGHTTFWLHKEERTTFESLRSQFGKVFEHMTNAHPFTCTRRCW